MDDSDDPRLWAVQFFVFTCRTTTNFFSTKRHMRVVLAWSSARCCFAPGSTPDPQNNTRRDEDRVWKASGTDDCDDDDEEDEYVLIHGGLG